MKAIYQGKEKEIWVISRTGERPDWIDYGFKANYIHWTSEAEKELMADVGGLVITNIGKKYVNRPVRGSGVYFGKPGDVINLTDGIIVSAKKFEQIYKIVNDRH